MEEKKDWALFYAVDSTDGLSCLDDYRIEYYNTRQEAEEAFQNFRRFMKAAGGFERIIHAVVQTVDLPAYIEQVKPSSVNEICIMSMKFEPNAEGQDVRYGFLVYDAFDQGFDNTLDEPILGARKILRKLTEEGTTMSVHKLLARAKKFKNPFMINGECFAWDDVKEFFEEF